MELAIIFIPERDQRLAMSREALSFPLREKAPTKGGKIGEVELTSLTLCKGCNFIPKADWEKAESHEPCAQRIKALINKGAIAIIAPSDENPIGCTADYANIEDVRTIVENIGDESWLNRSLARDQRQMVFKLISDRLQELKEMRRLREQRQRKALV